MYNLLEMMREELGDKKEVLEKIDEIYRKRREKGLIVRAKKEKVRKRDIVGYLIKYVASPPIALSRITNYDFETVTYWYREHPTDRKVIVKVSAYEFIKRMIQHIMSKGFQAVGHYGLYARRKVGKVREQLEKLFEGVKEVAQEFQQLLSGSPFHRNYRERIKESFGKDPFFCGQCKLEMILCRIWHPKHGTIYDLYESGHVVDEGEISSERFKIEKEVEKQLCFAI